MKKIKFWKIRVGNFLLGIALGFLLVLVIEGVSIRILYAIIFTVFFGALLKFLGTREKYLKIKKGLEA